MARLVTQNAISTFENRGNGTFNNTKVISENGITKLFLHGNLIAKVSIEGLYITNAGWESNTTKERLNGINGVSIQQKKGVWYLNGTEWNGELIKVN